MLVPRKALSTYTYMRANSDDDVTKSMRLELSKARHVVKARLSRRCQMTHEKSWPPRAEGAPRLSPDVYY